MPTRRALIALLAAAAAAACTSPPACAVGSLVDLQIVDRSRGDLLTTYRYRGASYVAGQPGARYAVRLVNRSAARVLVVLSVDGVNAVSGDTAATGQTGYVLGPWQSTDITGWRKSDAEAAAFYFTALPDSYAARTGRPDNVGVIGAAVFRERVQEQVQQSFAAPPSRDRVESTNRPEPERYGAAADANGTGNGAASERARPAPAAAPSPTTAPLAKAEKLGTGHGEREYSPITLTSFERATTQPAEIVQMRYDSYANLAAAGIVARPRIDDGPRAFPGYVPDPR